MQTDASSVISADQGQHDLGDKEELPENQSDAPLLMSSQQGPASPESADLRARISKTLSLNRQKNENLDSKGNGKTCHD